MHYPFGQNDQSPEPPTESTIRRSAELLDQGYIVGWYQGHGEIGPRALGNRSILMDPRIPDGKDILNHKVKRREWWRPFGASILEQYTREYFTSGQPSPHMLYNYWFKDPTLFPAITHVDGSCRIQTVGDTHPVFQRLLSAFHAIAGIPLVLNTSLNLGGRPIVGNPRDALALLNTTGLDYLVIGDTIYDR